MKRPLKIPIHGNSLDLTGEQSINSLLRRQRDSESSNKTNITTPRRSSPLRLSLPNEQHHHSKYSQKLKERVNSLRRSEPRRYSIPTASSFYLPPTPNQTQEHITIGEYSIVRGEVIGRGGFSTVYSVKDRLTRNKYALKVVDLSTAVHEDLRVNLLREVKILESLIGNRHVIQLLAHNAQSARDGQVFILMELGQGDLQQVLQQNAKQNLPLNPEFVRYWGGQVLKAVAAIHEQSIVHSDLKPANFIINNGMLKLCDFGISNRVPEHTSSIHRKDAIGTLLYMAPEALRQSTVGSIFRITRACDVWSCGILLFEMVYQQYPYSDRTYLQQAESNVLEEVTHPKVTTANSPVPLALHEVIKACLLLDPSERPTAEEASNSVFFSPVSVDMSAVLSMTKCVHKFNQQLIAKHESATPAMLEELAHYLYDRLVCFNNGITTTTNNNSP